MGTALHSALAWLNLVDVKIAQEHNAPLNDVRVGRANVRRQLIYTAVQLCCVIVGIAAMTLPEPERSPGSIAALIASLAIIVEEVLLIVNALLDNVDRVNQLRRRMRNGT